VKIDKFTVIVIAIVLVLLIAAIVTVNRTDNREGVDTAEYISSDSPDAPVQNAFIALQKGDLFTAREQYAARIVDDENSEYAYGPLGGNGGRYETGDTTRRLRILSVEIDDKNPDQALVTFVLDTYSNRGPFGTGSTWSNQRTVEVVREDGAWKINTPEFFY
jgi:hypothetical protein